MAHAYNATLRTEEDAGAQGPPGVKAIYQGCFEASEKQHGPNTSFGYLALIGEGIKETKVEPREPAGSGVLQQAPGDPGWSAVHTANPGWFLMA